KPRASVVESKLHPDAGTNEDSASILTSAAASQNDGSKDFTRDLARLAPAPPAASPGLPIGRAQSVPSGAPLVRGAEPGAPSTLPQPSTSSVREIAVRIAPPQAPSVDVHLVARRGEVQVSVRTADGGLQTSLQQDLGTLVNSLERSGTRAEVFVP